MQVTLSKIKYDTRYSGDCKSILASAVGDDISCRRVARILKVYTNTTDMTSARCRHTRALMITKIHCIITQAHSMQHTPCKYKRSLFINGTTFQTPLCDHYDSAHQLEHHFNATHMCSNGGTVLDFAMVHHFKLVLGNEWCSVW